MFCPECGTLGFMSPDGNIRCTDYKCGYEGPLGGSDGKGAEFTDPMTGEDRRFIQSDCFFLCKGPQASYRSCGRRGRKRNSLGW